MPRKLIVFFSIFFIGIKAVIFITKDFKKAEPTIYINGEIITMDDDLPLAQAMFIENGIIKAIGSNEAISRYKKSGVKVVDLHQAVVLPGFIDVHTHVALSTFLENMIDLSGFKHHSAQEVWEHLNKEINKAKPGEWIVCKGIDQILVRDLESPTIEYLDKIAPENPLLLLSQSLHTYWANSLAFERAGINKETPNPSKSSYYDRDQQGNLTGLIVEQQAFSPFITELKKEVLTPKALTKSTAKVMNKYAKNGNTTVVSAGITINDAKPLRLYEHLSAKEPSFINQLLAVFGLLPKRAQYPRHFIYIRYDREFLLPEKTNKTDDFYDIIGIKHWYDGSPYAGSMYMNEPYINSKLTKELFHIPEGHRGKSLISPGELKAFIKKYQKMGWQIAIHAQGNAAIDEILQAYEQVNRELDITNQRHRIEHCLLLTDKSIDKMKALNITPSFHINHLYYYGNALKNSILGEKRANKILPVASTKNKHIKFSLHADQPMFESKPFRLLQTAVERRTREGDTLGIDQKISVLDGLKALSINAAWQIHKENKLGSLAKNKYADFIIVDKNPLKIPIKDLENIKILKVYINGNEVKN